MDGNYTTDIFTMSVTAKPSLIVTGGPASVSTRLPNSTSVTTLPYSSDENSLEYRKILYVNNTLWSMASFGVWMVWDEVNQIVSVTPNQNS